MTDSAVTQLTINFEPSLPERYPTLRDFVAYRAHVQAKSLKTIAADMDIAPSTLSRKLHPAEGDTQRMNLDDLEAYLKSTGDVACVVEYLSAKYMAGGDKARKARTLSRMETLMGELARAAEELKAQE